MFIMVSSVTSNKSLRLMGYLLTRYHFPRTGLLYGFLVEKLNFQRNMFLTPPILHRDDKADCINSGSPSVSLHWTVTYIQTTLASTACTSTNWLHLILSQHALGSLLTIQTDRTTLIAHLTIQRHRQHWEQDKERGKKQTQKTKKISNIAPPRRWSQVLATGKQFLLLIRNPPSYF